jgi:hypothetical protein
MVYINKNTMERILISCLRSSQHNQLSDHLIRRLDATIDTLCSITFERISFHCKFLGTAIAFGGMDSWREHYTARVVQVRPVLVLQ